MTQLRCRPGDLAVIVNAGDVPEMLGRYVRVDALAAPYVGGPPGSAYTAGAVWECSVAGADLAAGYLCDGDGTGPLHRGRDLDIPDAWLRPIRDSEPAADESTTEQRTLQLS